MALGFRARRSFSVGVGATIDQRLSSDSVIGQLPVLGGRAERTEERERKRMSLRYHPATVIKRGRGGLGRGGGGRRRKKRKRKTERRKMGNEEREERGKKAERKTRAGFRPIHSGSLPSISQVFLDLYSDNLPTSHYWVRSYHP